MADLKLTDLPELLKSHQIAILAKKGLPVRYLFHIMHFSPIIVLRV